MGRDNASIAIVLAGIGTEVIELIDIDAMNVVDGGFS